MSHNIFYYKDEIVFLSGSARDRRKQFRLLRKKYPNCVLKGISVIKTLNGKRVECEEANIVRTQVNIK